MNEWAPGNKLGSLFKTESATGTDAQYPMRPPSAGLGDWLGVKCLTPT